ncbi:MAG: IPT/TIG domain-containing protein [Pseudonocardiaceae bacterium]
MTVSSESNTSSRTRVQEQLTSIDPKHGPVNGGQGVTIYGVNLQDVVNVVFGVRDANNVTVVNEREVTCVSPRAESRGLVKAYAISDVGTTSNTVDYTYVETYS